MKAIWIGSGARISEEDKGLRTNRLVLWLSDRQRKVISTENAQCVDVGGRVSLVRDTSTNLLTTQKTNKEGEYVGKSRFVFLETYAFLAFCIAAKESSGE